MANYLSEVELLDGNSYELKDKNKNIFFGTCPTAAATAAKVITLTNGDGFELKAGAFIGVKFTYSNSASDVTLNVNGTGAKSIWYNNAVYTSTSSNIAGYANRVLFYMYDGTYWVLVNKGWVDDNTYPSAYCSTAAGTAAKVASCSGYVLLAKSYLHIIMTNANTAASALTLNVNSKGAKPIYINGIASSSSNYTLPAGSYIVYYDGTNYYFRTDGKITGSITGDAATVNGHTLNVDVPANAVFTDNNTTYAVVSTSANGLAPKVTSTSAFLKGNGTWATPTNTTYASLKNPNAITIKTYNGDPTSTDTTYDGSSTKSISVAGTNAITGFVQSTASTYLQVRRADGTESGGFIHFPNASTLAAGALKQLDGSTTHYLRGDGTWATPPDNNTTYTNATSTTAGLIKLTNDNTKYLNGTGGWSTPPNTTYAVATTAANGLMSSTDKNKINKIDWIFYDSVTDLDLTSGSCSIQQAYSAMADKTVLICNAGDFNSSSVPSAYGIIEIIKYGGARWYIVFHAKDSTVADYRMYPLEGNNTPSGIWSTDNTINGILGLNSTLSSLTNYDSKCWCVGDNGYLYLNITLSSYTNGTQIAQMAKLRPAATMDVNIVPNAGSPGPYLRLQTDGQIMLYNFTASTHKGVRGLFSFPCTTNHPSPTF